MSSRRLGELVAGEVLRQELAKVLGQPRVHRLTSRHDRYRSLGPP